MSKLQIYCVTNKRLPFLEQSSYKLCSVGKEFLHDKYLNSNSLTPMPSAHMSIYMKKIFFDSLNGFDLNFEVLHLIEVPRS